MSRTAIVIASLSIFAVATVAFATDGMKPVRSDLSEHDLARVAAITAPAVQFDTAERFENRQGGAATFTKVIDANAFSHFSQNLSFEGQEQFNLGNALFRKLWVSSPASTLASDGLGPLFNARSCQSCHLKDGRGRPPEGDEPAVSLFLRLSVPVRTDAQQALLDSHRQGVIGDPIYGTQLQTFAVPGVPAEAELGITYEEIPVQLADGEIVHLRKPTYTIDDPRYGQPDPDLMISPRVTPQMIGLGLIEAIAAEDILARADPDDVDDDGISGRTNWAFDPQTGRVEIGRFGWKAGVPSIFLQSASAFAGDIGISTPSVPSPFGDCTDVQTRCVEAATGVQAHLGDTEAPDPILDLVTFYARNLAVPVRRNAEDPQVLAGKQLFYETGCIACHTPKYVTSREAEAEEQRFQLIWPYSDLLLHDMGDGLADHRPEGAADGNEWRTPPLWGVGLTATVSAHTYFLHDGRARNLLEAILWHGGEAAAVREKVMAMDETERESLLAFLESL